MTNTLMRPCSAPGCVCLAELAATYCSAHAHASGCPGPWSVGTARGEEAATIPERDVTVTIEGRMFGSLQDIAKEVADRLEDSATLRWFGTVEARVVGAKGLASSWDERGTGADDGDDRE